MFLRKTKRREPAAVTMSGVRMGERLLQVGVENAATAGVIAAKVGLSGSAAVAVPDEAAAGRVHSAAADAGVLMDVRVTPLNALPLPDASIDVVVVHALQALGGAGGSLGALRECHRVLRRGGRVIVMEAGRPAGAFDRLRVLLRGRQERAGQANSPAVAAVQAAGFRPVRTVGELDGVRFTEGLKAAPH